MPMGIAQEPDSLAWFESPRTFQSKVKNPDPLLSPPGRSTWGMFSKSDGEIVKKKLQIQLLIVSNMSLQTIIPILE